MSQNQNTADRVSSDVLVGLKAIGETVGLTTNEAVLRWIHEEDLPARKMGRAWRSRRSVIERWYDQKLLEQV